MSTIVTRWTARLTTDVDRIYCRDDFGPLAALIGSVGNAFCAPIENREFPTLYVGSLVKQL